MANFANVNRAIKKNFPHLKVEVVRGEGYVYFDGADGFDKVESIAVNPVSIDTNDLVRLATYEIEKVHGKMVEEATVEPKKAVRQPRAKKAPAVGLHADSNAYLAKEAGSVIETLNIPAEKVRRFGGGVIGFIQSNPVKRSDNPFYRGSVKAKIWDSEWMAKNEH